MNLREAFKLTKTEDQVARLLLLGTAPKEIAGLTGKSLSTIRNHEYTIFLKARVPNAMAFVIKVAQTDGWQNGLLYASETYK
jgi:DNA-binding CsgD family transcriptional regulator